MAYASAQYFTHFFSGNNVMNAKLIANATLV